MTYPIVALSVSFALGAAVVLHAQYLHPVACKPEAVAPKKIRPARETVALSHPLCAHGWVKSCADWGECREACLTGSVQ